jgi:activator of 2-hydroxyglutaryl-CoA dehydratase
LKTRLDALDAAAKADADKLIADAVNRSLEEDRKIKEIKEALRLEFEEKLNTFKAEVVYNQSSWHTEIVAGIVIGSLATAVVVLVANPAVLVAVAHGGGWGSGVAGVVESVLTFCGWTSVIDASAAAAATLAAELAATLAAAEIVAVPFVAAAVLA